MIKLQVTKLPPSLRGLRKQAPLKPASPDSISATPPAVHVTHACSDQERPGHCIPRGATAVLAAKEGPASTLLPLVARFPCRPSAWSLPRRASPTMLGPLPGACCSSSTWFAETLENGECPCSKRYCSRTASVSTTVEKNAVNHL